MNVVGFTRTPRMRSAGSWSSVSDCEDEDDLEAGAADAGTNVINILNSLEQMGYKVVTSGAFVASQSVNNNKVHIRRVSRKVETYCHDFNNNFIQLSGRPCINIIYQGIYTYT